MQKLMIITLGTGRGVENGLAKSILANKPDRLIFLATTESRQEMPEKIKQVIETTYSRKMPPAEIECIEDAENIENAYLTTLKVFEWAEQQGYAIDDIYLDFTSGTKAMSSGATLAAFLKDCKNLVYIGGGQRDEAGRVISCTEVVHIFRPDRIFTDYQQQVKKKLLTKGFSSKEVERIIKTLSSLAIPSTESLRRIKIPTPDR